MAGPNTEPEGSQVRCGGQQRRPRVGGEALASPSVEAAAPQEVGGQASAARRSGQACTSLSEAQERVPRSRPTRGHLGDSAAAETAAAPQERQQTAGLPGAAVPVPVTDPCCGSGRAGTSGLPRPQAQPPITSQMGTPRQAQHSEEGQSWGPHCPPQPSALRQPCAGQAAWPQEGADARPGGGDAHHSRWWAAPGASCGS